MTCKRSFSHGCRPSVPAFWLALVHALLDQRINMKIENWETTRHRYLTSLMTRTKRLILVLHLIWDIIRDEIRWMLVQYCTPRKLLHRCRWNTCSACAACSWHHVMFQSKIYTYSLQSQSVGGVKLWRLLSRTTTQPIGPTALSSLVLPRANISSAHIRCA